MNRFAAFVSFLMLFPSFYRLGSCFGPMRTLRSDHFNPPQASRSSRIDGFWWILVDLRVDLLVEPPSKDHSSVSISQYEPKMSRIHPSEPVFSRFGSLFVSFRLQIVLIPASRPLFAPFPPLAPVPSIFPRKSTLFPSRNVPKTQSEPFYRRYFY